MALHAHGPILLAGHQLAEKLAQLSAHSGTDCTTLPFLPTAAGGPILLEDYQLVEKLANFDRERIPERVVHARGASAKGFFEVGAGLLGAAFCRLPCCA